MKNLNEILVFLFCCCFIIGCSYAPIRRHSFNKLKGIILIGWDGTQRDLLKEQIKEQKLPNLSRIIQEGNLIDINVTTGDTSTKSGWAEILTGYSPEITGVYNNKYRYKPIQRGYTIFERLENYFGDKNIVTIFLAGKKNNLGANGTKMKGEPYRITKNHVDLFENGLGEAEKVGPRILEYINKIKDGRFFIFAEFSEPDELGHAFGEGSPAYIKGLLIEDMYLGEIVNSLKKLNIYDNTLIYVVSDHGFTKNLKEHNYAPETFLATNDPYVKRTPGDRKDIAPTILQRFGLNIGKIKPSLEGHSLY